MNASKHCSLLAMVRKKRKGTGHSTVIKVTASPERLDTQNPWHVLWIILALVVIGAIAIFLVRVLLYVLVIGGAAYLLYLLVHKNKLK